MGTNGVTDELRAAVLAEIRPWRQALSHAVRRDHEHRPQMCSGCDEAEALLRQKPSPALDALCARADEAEALADALRELVDHKAAAMDGATRLWNAARAALARYDQRVQAGGR